MSHDMPAYPPEGADHVLAEPDAVAGARDWYYSEEGQHVAALVSSLKQMLGDAIRERDAIVARADQLEKALRHYAHDHDEWLLRETRFANEALAQVPAEPATCHVDLSEGAA